MHFYLRFHTFLETLCISDLNMLYCNVPSTPQSFLDCTEGTSANFIFQYDLILLYDRQKTMAIFAGNWVDISLLTANNGSLAFMAATVGGTRGFQLVRQTDHYWLWCGLFFATVNLYEVASRWFYNKATAVVALFYLFPITILNIACICSEVGACYDSNY